MSRGSALARGTAPADDRAPALGEAGELARAHTAAALEGPRTAETCAELSCKVARLIDDEVGSLRAAGAPLACERGCTFCCHQRVGVLPHEAAALWNYLETAMPRDVAAVVEERLLRNAEVTDGMTADEHRAARVACAFLVDGRCSAYEVRPSTCASYHSLSRARCEYAFRHPEHAGTPRASRPALRHLHSFTSDVATGIAAGYVAAGIPVAKGELHRTVRAVAQDRGAIERWLTGAPLESEQ